MTTPTDTKALRELLAKACNPDGQSVVETLAAHQKFARACANAAPGMLDEIDALRAETVRLNAGWQEYLDALAIARNALASGADDREALRATIEQRTEQRDALKAEVERLRAAQTYLDVVFDGPPSHESGRFVEVENLEGFSVGAGEWIDRGNGFWALRLPVLRAALRGEEASDHIADATKMVRSVGDSGSRSLCRACRRLVPVTACGVCAECDGGMEVL